MLPLFWKYLKRLRPLVPFLTLTFIGDLIVMNFTLVTPLFSRLLFDYAYPLSDVSILNAVFAASVAIYFIQFFFNVSCDYLSTYVSQIFSGRLTRSLFDKVQKLPLKFHQERGTGDLVNLFTHDVGVVVNKTIETIPQFVLQFYFFVSILVIAFSMNYKITLLALASVPIYILESKYFARKEESLEELDIELDGEYYDTLQERLKGIKTVKAFGQEDYESERVALKRSEMNVIAIKRGLVTVLSAFTNSITIRMWTVALSWYMGFLVIGGELSVGEIVALLAYVAMMGDPIKALAQQYVDLKVAMVSFRRIDAVLSAKSEGEGETDEPALAIERGEIRFETVRFAYGESDSDEEAVLKDLEFRIASKTAVALVGESGSGKSTIVSLLMRFFSPNKGAIFIDGQDISEVRLKTLRDRIGLVEQDFSLFAGTLRDNIFYGNVDKSEAQLIDACKKAQIYDFISGLPDGFDHMIGPSGDGLSGGQKQRVAIARVLLRDPDIIVFDEATSALDPESEFRITEVMNSLIGKKNLLVVAHRLSTIKKADVILMLDRGRIVEGGTFHELIEKKGQFFRYYSRQFGGFDAFKRILETEFERTGRYASQFNLVAARAPYWEGIRSKLGDDTAFDYMDELGFMVRRSLRKGDNAAVLSRDTMLMLIPEINTDQLKQFFDRLSKLCRNKMIPVGETEFPADLEFSALHVEGQTVPTADDLIRLVVENLSEIENEKNYTIRTLHGETKIANLNSSMETEFNNGVRP